MHNQFSKVVLASNNHGKLVEFQHILQTTGMQIIPQAEYNVPEVAETGSTFVENALLKARAAAAISGCCAIADDSGLAVDALLGQPGIYSARFAGPKATGQENINLLLQKLAGLPYEQRKARFVCVLVLLRNADDPLPIIAQGTWEGYILNAARGHNGFGYDPIMEIPELDHKTVAELTAAEKSRYSHRAKALAALLAQLV